MPNNIYRFRRVKWADPARKLKVLAEDLRPRERILPFALLVAAVSLATFATVFVLGSI